MGYWLFYRFSTKDIGQDYVVVLVAKLMLAPKLKNDAVHNTCCTVLVMVSARLLPLCRH